MKVRDLIAMLSTECAADDEVYISDIKGNTPTTVAHPMAFNPAIAVKPLDPTEQDETGGWRDEDGEPIVGKPWQIF